MTKLQVSHLSTENPIHQGREPHSFALVVLVSKNPIQGRRASTEVTEGAPLKLHSLNVYCRDLIKNHCFLIQGLGSTGKSNSTCQNWLLATSCKEGVH